MNLSELLDRYGEALSRAVIDTYPPLYDAEFRRTRNPDLRRLLRRPLGGQGDAINAMVLSLQQHPGTIVVGEMGTGKSYIAAAAAYLAGHQRILIVCPPHLVKKWRREISQTVPGARATIVQTVGDLEEIRRSGVSPQFVICSRERAKLSYRWIPAVVQRFARNGAGCLLRGDNGLIATLLSCPNCFTTAVDDEGVPLTRFELRAKKRVCHACGGALWQADRTGPRRVALADFVRRRMKGVFDLLIVDEAHEFKARGSAQGLAAEALSGACRKCLILTGTLFGGYSSTLFYLLWRFSPAVRRGFGYRDESRWISRYGIVERITRRSPDTYAEDGRHSKRRNYLTRTIEKPGVTPSVLLHLIGNTIFLRLEDVARDLPSYTEQVVICGLDRASGPESPSQASCYQRLATELRQATVAALAAGSKRLLAGYLQALLAYPDACTRGETVLDSAIGSVIADVPALPEDVLYPKERSLVGLALRERARGRRLLVYITHTERRDISPRLRKILEQAGLAVAILKADTVTADRREEWLASRVGEGAEVLICHPRLVQTGLDLIDWPSICWYETEYSVYVMRQASRRSWRIGQRQPVEVTFMVYEGTLQAEALALVAAKMRSALMIEGELQEDGLVALAGEGDDTMLALARRLVDPDSLSGASLEVLFSPGSAEKGRPVDSPVSNGDVLVDDSSGIDFDPPDDGGCQAEEMSHHRGRVFSFDEIALLIRKPKTRRRTEFDGQLSLFEA